MKRLIVVLLLVGFIVGGFVLNSEKGTLTLHDPKMAAAIQIITGDKVSVLQTNKLGDKSAIAFFSIKSKQYGEMYGTALLEKKWNGKYRIPPITEKNDSMVQWGTNNDWTASYIETKDGFIIAKPVKDDRANQIGLTFKLFDENGKEINIR
jgi:hypothetical protein